MTAGSQGWGVCSALAGSPCTQAWSTLQPLPGHRTLPSPSSEVHTAPGDTLGPEPYAVWGTGSPRKRRDENRHTPSKERHWKGSAQETEARRDSKGRFRNTQGWPQMGLLPGRRGGAEGGMTPPQSSVSKPVKSLSIGGSDAGSRNARGTAPKDSQPHTRVCMHAHRHTVRHTATHVCAHFHTLMHSYVHTPTYAHVHVYTHTHPHTPAHVHVHTCTHLYQCHITHMCMCLAHIYTHVHTHAHTEIPYPHACTHTCTDTSATRVYMNANPHVWMRTHRHVYLHPCHTHTHVQAHANAHRSACVQQHKHMHEHHTCAHTRTHKYVTPTVKSIH